MKAPKPNFERLEKLAWLMENYKKELPRINHGITDFDMSNWLEPSYEDRDSGLAYKECSIGKLKQWSCGTSACALGSAMYHPWFIEQGLVPSRDGRTPNLIVGCRRSPLGGFAVASKFFGITDEQSEWLFDPEKYDDDGPNITPAQVAKRVRTLIACLKISLPVGDLPPGFNNIEESW